ncbi:MAG: low affinity iron permease family protein [Reyranellaceae bacterium]
MITGGNLFTRVTRAVAKVTGRPLSFCVAICVIVLWAVSGPFFGYSDTWQLVINTGTTIVTFLMVFLIQATQNRDTTALQLKLDELIRCVEGAHNAMLDLEELTEEEIEMVHLHYSRLADLARRQARAGECDTDKPDINPFHPEAASAIGKAASRVVT